MSDIIMIALVLYVSVLIFYSLGVLGQNRDKCIKPMHVIYFWLSVVAAVTGIVYLNGHFGEGTISWYMLMAGVGVIWLIGHTIWATAILILRSDQAFYRFQEFSVLIWLVWLVPYFTGLLSGLSRQ